MIVDVRTGEVLEQEPKVLAEFRELIPPLKEGEFEQLQDNILSEGIRDALVIWKEEGLLLDGHNRLSIAQNNRLDYRVTTVSLPNKDAARRWILLNQLGRRNLTPQQMKYVRGKLHNEEKSNEPFKGNQYTSGGYQNDTNQKTAERIAQQTGVSAPTVYRDAKFAEAIDRIADVAGPEARDRILSGEVRMSSKDVEETAELADEAPDLIPDIASGKKNVTQAKREIVRRERKDAPPLPEDIDKYRVVYADPPWKYGNSGLDDYGHAERHYPVMSIEELCDLNVKDLAASDAVLFLWVTSPLLAECFDVIKAWGFKYKTSFVWDKVRHNFGHYNSVRHEFLLICTRGSCTPDNKKLYDSVQVIEKTDVHSQKPEEFRNIIDHLYAEGKKIELFARREADGWDTWGNEV